MTRHTGGPTPEDRSADTPPDFGTPAGHGEVGRALPHESAALHVSGEACYVDDLPELAGTLHAALGLSPLACARIRGCDLARVRAQSGVVAVFSAADIPGNNDCGPVVHDDPVLADGEVRYVGQPVFVVVAQTRSAARRAAALARDVLDLEPLPAALDVRVAAGQGSFVLPPMRLVRETAGGVAAALTAAPHRFGGSFAVGGQEHFYLEGQISYAVPQEGGGMRVFCSTQHPSEMQHAVAAVLGVASHRVQVACRRMGGGFGGKESQSALFACAAALAASRLARPVKLRPDRDDDFSITGKRHSFAYDYDVGFDGDGRVMALSATLLSRCGHSADLSGPVMSRALCHVDNAYWLPDVDLRGLMVRTNTQSDTAFRGFGGPQGAFLTECLLDKIARRLRVDPLQVRLANLYRDGQSTPYGQAVVDSVLPALIAQLVLTSEYHTRRAAIRAFNQHSPVLKRGLALTPVKFGISFNLKHLNQAGALVHIYADGSILVNHGGTEMGQGLHTKVVQVVAHELGVSVARVRVTATDTEKVANTSATAASSGSDLNGMAAADAARKLRGRLAECAATQFGVTPAEVHFRHDQVVVGAHQIPFTRLVRQAYEARVQLWADGFYATPGLSWDRTTMNGSPFYYFAYGAAVSEVVIDTLTGESRLLRADILHDVGASLNPAVDLGQIEGAFLQGVGWLTSEELVWDHHGRLLTHAPSTYKIPTANDCPTDLRVALFANQNAAATIHRSKAVGEPPFLLAFSVWLAIKDAVAAVGGDACDPELAVPATPEAVLRAVSAVRVR